MSGTQNHASVIDDAWDSVVGGFDWLKSVLFGEFEDNRPLSAIIADMLLSFIPAVIIATSARDAIAVILRMAKHPEKREEVLEWVLLCACLITIALPIAMAAAGVAAAGVGAVVGGIAGSELGAALRAVMLLLVKASTKLVELIQFLQKFIKGDILKFLKAIKFAKYEQALLSAVKQFTGKLIDITKGLASHLESLSYFQYSRNLIAKLKAWEQAFYAVQTAAIKKIPLAMAELDARLTKVLAETLPRETHTVPAGVKAPKPEVVKPATQHVSDVPGRILRDAEESAPKAGANPAAGKTELKKSVSKPPEDKPPLKDKAEDVKPAGDGKNTKKQSVANPRVLAGKASLDAETSQAILDTPKGSRPDPNTYMSQQAIDTHLEQFQQGVTKIAANPPKGNAGPPGGTFVMPKSTADELIKRSNGSSAELEKMLSLDPGTLGQAPMRIDIKDPIGLRMPSGNELGANSQWLPGGYTGGGIPEATIDSPPPTDYVVKSIFGDQ